MIITIIIVLLAFMLGIVVGVLGLKYILLSTLNKENAERKQLLQTGRYGKYISYYKDQKFPVLKTREEAETILSELNEIINVYGQASITDLKELLGVTASSVEYRFGWKDLTHAHVAGTYGGYMLRLPETVILESEVSINA
jgi:hypothetical protein